MEYKFKKNEKPLFASIDWKDVELWASLELPLEDVKGMERLIINYAKKQGVFVEYTEKDGKAVFVVFNIDHTLMNEYEKAKNSVIDALKNSGKMTKMQLRAACKTYEAILPKITKELLKEGRIAAFVDKGIGQGRPKTYFELV